MATVSVEREHLPVERVAGVPVDELPIGVGGTASTAWWGMTFFIITEATLFAYLFFSYYYLGSRHSEWPANGAPELKLAVINTVILVSSSAPMWLADRVLGRGRIAFFSLLLGTVLVMGTAFLIIEATEWSNQSFAPATNAYSSLFYTITGFHFAHVTLGLLMIVELLYRALVSRIDVRRPLATRNVAVYWHFVGVVWVILFLTIYISPRVW
ncbi:MAG TPA: cytochrome c oxidase subunit 3 [Gemmatimonadaceae bacterium]|nr:cytochrome c oxidase subunit 3 [Gemmatimonadaceae bacterium]